MGACALSYGRAQSANNNFWRSHHGKPAFARSCITAALAEEQRGQHTFSRARGVGTLELSQHPQKRHSVPGRRKQRVGELGAQHRGFPQRKKSACHPGGSSHVSKPSKVLCTRQVRISRFYKGRLYRRQALAREYHVAIYWRTPQQLQCPVELSGDFSPQGWRVFEAEHVAGEANHELRRFL